MLPPVRLALPLLPRLLRGHAADEHKVPAAFPWQGGGRGRGVQDLLVGRGRLLWVLLLDLCGVWLWNYQHVRAIGGVYVICDACTNAPRHVCVCGSRRSRRSGAGSHTPAPQKTHHTYRDDQPEVIGIGSRPFLLGC